MSRPGRGFRVFITVLLLGIFFELMAIISILGGESARGGNVGVLEVTGVIEDPLPVLEDLRKLLEDDEIKALVVRVDSPGGAVGASQEIYEELLKAKKKKKVVVSMGNVAASGGYYIAAAGDKIFAAPGTLTGSLGVIAQFFVLEDLLKKAYLRWEVVKSGDVKDLGSPLHPMTPKERAILQSLSDDIHAQFIEAVASSRNLKIEEVRKIADGRVFSGRQAKEAGLVDELGTIEGAVRMAAKLAGVSEDAKARYPERERFGWFKRFVEGKLETRGLKIEYRMVP